MHVRKRTWKAADGTVKTAWQARWTDFDGRTRTRTFRSKRAALAHLDVVEADLASGRRQSDQRLGEWLDHWLTVIVAGRVSSGGISPTTAVRHEQVVRVHLKPQIGHAPLAGLNVADVESMMSRLLVDYKPATVRKIRAVLSKALSDAQRRDLVSRNVAQLSEPPAVRTVAPSAFTADELDRLIAVWRQHPYGPLLEFVLLTGLRASEAVGLRWSDVDLDAGVYRLGRGLHRLSGEHVRTVGLEPGVVVSAGKNVTASKPTPMSAAAVTLLRKVKLAQPSGARWSREGLVFTSEVGGPLDASKVRKVLVEVAAEAGVPLTTEDGRPRKLHELRRTWATRLRSAGVPIEDIAVLGRWASPRVLMEHYAASPDERLRDAVEKAADGV